MFFFVLFIFFTAVIVRHYASEYRKLAVKTGEANLSPGDKSILPFAGKCKVFSEISFGVLAVTGLLFLLSKSTDGIFLGLDKYQWQEIHLTFVIVFLGLAVFLTYVHWDWFRKAVLSKIHLIR